jgi:tetratricopeptide (TPR) repeat protein
LAQVRPLLPGSPGCLAVVTSRRDLGGLVAILGAPRLTVEVLDPERARQLLCDRIGAVRVSAEPEAVDRIVAACAGLPLALAIVAAGATRHPIRSLTAIADDLQPALDRLSIGDDPATDVRAVLSWSYRALPADAARLFRLLGVHPGPDVAAEAVASLAGLRADELASPLAELVSMHLLVAADRGRFGMHDLLREYAHELAQGDEATARRRATARLVTYYLGTAEAALRMMDPPRDDHIRLVPVADRSPMTDAHEARAWFQRERRALVATVDLAFREGMDEHAWQLARAMGTFLDRDLHWDDWHATTTVALQAAERLGHTAAQAAAHRALALVAFQQGRRPDATNHLETALALFEAAGDAANQAATHNSMGGFFEESGRYEEALDHSRQAHRLFELAGDEIGQAHALNSIGWCEARLGRYSDALASCTRSAERLRELGERFGEAVAWDSIGFIRHTMGDQESAVGCFERALELFRAVGERFYESVTLDHLGDCHHDLDQQQEAVTAWQQALDLVRDVDPGLADALRTKIGKALSG